MKDALAIFRFLLEANARGERTVLVTLTDVTGSSSRAPGTHMAVCETGAYAGSLSGGCVEAAVVSEAIAVLGRGQAELIRFGAGSRFIDIRLPCGGGIDLLFTPDPSPIVLAAAIEGLERRHDVSLRLGLDGSLDVDGEPETGWSGDVFSVQHRPDLQLLVVGHGAEVIAMARLGMAFGALVSVFSPDTDALAAAGALGVDTTRLLTPDSTSDLSADERTAVIFLFHDHDWEPALMEKALRTEAYFVGAMGSRQTHARRCDLLASRGVPNRIVKRLVGPIGLIKASRDPDTLALSVLAEVIEAGRKTAGTASDRRVDEYAA